MATKRKPAKKSRKTARRKAKPTKKLVKKAKSSRKSAARNKPARGKAPAKAKRQEKKASSAKKPSSRQPSRQPSPQPSRQQRPARSARAFSRDLRGLDSAGQSGDLQGLSNRERADSESVDELLEEGNSFEAGVVEGVEEADENEGREVHTHEVPEDDVPGEYLDED